MKYSSRRNAMLDENEASKEALALEKKRLQALQLLPRRGVTPEIMAARARWIREHPEAQPPHDWEKFSMG